LDTRLQRRSGRPLLQTDNPRNTIKSLMDQRYPIYAEADLMIETSNLSFEQVLDSAYTAITKYFSSN
jgi:shikimate kinase